MKAKEVLTTLNITRPTLSKYTKTGLIKVDSIVNGQYNYNRQSVMDLLYNQTEESETTQTANLNEINCSTTRDIRDVAAENLTDSLMDVCGILSQLSQLRLLTPDSQLKLNKIKDNLKITKEIFEEIEARENERFQK